MSALRRGMSRRRGSQSEPAANRPHRSLPDPCQRLLTPMEQTLVLSTQLCGTEAVLRRLFQLAGVEDRQVPWDFRMQRIVPVHGAKLLFDCGPGSGAGNCAATGIRKTGAAGLEPAGLLSGKFSRTDQSRRTHAAANSISPSSTKNERGGFSTWSGRWPVPTIAVLHGYASPGPGRPGRR